MRRTIMAALAGVALAFTTLLTAPAAQATVTGRCWIKGDVYARLSVSQWTLYDGFGTPYRRIHMDLNNHSKYRAYALYVNGAKQGGWNDRYASRYSGGNTITGEWLQWILGGDSYWKFRCSVRMP